MLARVLGIAATVAMAAVIIRSGQYWESVLLVAPLYLAVQTHRIFRARLDDQRRHLAELARLAAERRELLERETAEAANRLKDQFRDTLSHE